MTIKCKDCMYWDNSDTSHSYPAALDDKYGKCTCDAFNYECAVDDRTDMLIYSDYEGWDAFFDTGADFGCIHAKKKP